METEFYVYVYLDPRKMGNFKYGEYEFEYEPFYVGKGRGYRLYEHLRPSRLNKDSGNIIKKKKLRKILKDGYEPIVIKIIDNVSEDVSLKIECELINLMGRINIRTGILTNMTDGGDGVSGRLITDEFKENQSKLMKEYYSENPIPNDVKDKISETLLNMKITRSEETKRKIGNANRGRVFSDKYKEQIKILRVGPKLTHRNKYVLISPEGYTYNILGRDELDSFINDHDLSLRRLLNYINKGKIKQTGRTTNTKNCFGWEIKKL